MDVLDLAFPQASAVEPIDEGRFRARVPDGWQQGRGAFGGLGIGIAIRAMEAVEGDRPLRALTAELPGPLMPGEVEVRVGALRRGTGMTTLEAKIVQDGETKVRANGVFGQTRVEHSIGAPTVAQQVTVSRQPRRRAAPERKSDAVTSGATNTIAVRDWREVPPIPAGMMGPSFSRFFEYRVTGPAPFASGAEAIVEGFTRPLGEAARWGAAEVAAMADAYWPAVFSTMSGPRPMATVTYTLQLTAKAHALDASAPLFFRSRVLGAEGGFISELRELFDASGSLVAINPQTFVIIK